MPSLRTFPITGAALEQYNARILAEAEQQHYDCYYQHVGSTNYGTVTNNVVYQGVESGNGSPAASSSPRNDSGHATTLMPQSARNLISTSITSRNDTINGTSSCCNDDDDCYLSNTHDSTILNQALRINDHTLKEQKDLCHSTTGTTLSVSKAVAISAMTAAGNKKRPNHCMHQNQQKRQDHGHGHGHGQEVMSTIEPPSAALLTKTSDIPQMIWKNHSSPPSPKFTSTSTVSSLNSWDAESFTDTSSSTVLAPRFKSHPSMTHNSINASTKTPQQQYQISHLSNFATSQNPHMTLSKPPLLPAVFNRNTPRVGLEAYMAGFEWWQKSVHNVRTNNDVSEQHHVHLNSPTANVDEVDEEVQCLGVLRLPPFKKGNVRFPSASASTPTPTPTPKELGITKSKPKSKNTTMSKEKMIRAQRSIGKMSRAHQRSIEKRISDLKAFHKVHGHYHVPHHSGDDVIQNLAQWHCKLKQMRVAMEQNNKNGIVDPKLLHHLQDGIRRCDKSLQGQI